VIRISSLDLASALGGLLLGFALIGTTPVVLAGEAQTKTSLEAPRSEARVPARQPIAAVEQTSSKTTAQADEPRRAVRIVYVGPVTAR
jgi:hypothetical protein